MNWSEEVGYSNGSNFSATTTTWTLLTKTPLPMQVLLLLLAVAIVVTNSVIIVFYFRSAQVRSHMSVFLLSLAVVDLQNGLLSLPILVFFPRSTLGVTSLSQGVCLFLVTWPQVLYTVAYHSVCLVTLERVLAVVNPFKFGRRHAQHQCRIATVFAVWTLATFLSFLPALPQHILSGSSQDRLVLCDGHYNASAIYLQLYFFCLVLTPLLFLLILYVVMYRVARHHARRLETNIPMHGKKDVEQQTEKEVAQPEVTRRRAVSLQLKSEPTRPKFNKSQSVVEVVREGHVMVSVANGNDDVVNDAPRRLSRSDPLLTNSSAVRSLKQRFGLFYRRRTIARHSRAAKTTTLLSAFYVISWLPLMLLVQVSGICRVRTCPDVITRSSLQSVVPFAMFLAFLSSAINPLIYILRTDALKREVSRTARKCRERPSRMRAKRHQ